MTAPPHVVAAVELALRRGVVHPSLHEGRPSPMVGVQLALGAHPTELAPGLTHREACAWASQSEHASPLAWAWHHIARPAVPGLPAECTARSIEVVRWVAGLRGDRLAAFFAERDVGAYVARVDELLPADLRRSVPDTWAAAVARDARDRWSGDPQLVPLDEVARYDLPPGVRLLATIADLIAEGRAMRHCVGSHGHPEAVADGRERLFSIVTTDGGYRSTLAVGPDGSVLEHRGPRNEPPSPASESIAREVMARVAEVRR